MILFERLHNGISENSHKENIYKKSSRSLWIFPQMCIAGFLTASKDKKTQHQLPIRSLKADTFS
jgi:hypothetical protein